MTTEKDVKIHVKGLKKSFGHVHVLKGIDAEIKAGEVICVIGPSGSGKSTFLRCLNRLEDPTDGRIIFAGEDLMDPKTDIVLRKRIQILTRFVSISEWYSSSLTCSLIIQ